MNLRKMLSEKRAFVPASGYNLVGVDEFEAPGEKLYLIGHFATRGTAERALGQRKANDPNERLYVYAAPGAR